MDAGGSRARQDRRDTGGARRSGPLAVLCALLALAAIVALIAGGCGADGSASAPGASASPAPSGPRAASRVRAALLRDDQAIDGIIGYAPFIALGGAGHKEIALTFDDGPGPSTPALLDYLKADAVPATFFLVGRSVAQHTNVVRREVEAGFSVGSHTESHGRLAGRTIADQQDEILTTADRITRISRHAVRLFRPPYGSYDAHTLDVLHAERMLMVLWNVDPRDYAATTPRQIAAGALEAARPGAIILLHDGPGARPNTLAAARMIVPALRRRGYRLVSVPELLRDDPPPRRQRAPRGGGA